MNITELLKLMGQVAPTGTTVAIARCDAPELLAAHMPAEAVDDGWIDACAWAVIKSWSRASRFLGPTTRLDAEVGRMSVSARKIDDDTLVLAMCPTPGMQGLLSTIVDARLEALCDAWSAIGTRQRTRS